MNVLRASGVPGGAAWRIRRAVMGLALACVAAVSALAGCGNQRPPAGTSRSQGERLTHGWMPVVYAGLRVDIPHSWRVVNLQTDRAACMSYDGRTLYLGWDSAPPCPASPADRAGMVELARLSATPWAAVRPMGAPVRVDGQAGYPVKGPSLLAFPGLNLLVVPEPPGRAVGQRILHSLRQVGPITTPAPSPPATAVSAMGLTGAGAGWALTARGLFATGSDGRAWADITPPGLRPRRVSGVFFLDRRRGWVAEGVPPRPARHIPPGEIIYRTADGGARWQAARLRLPGQRYYDTGFVNWAVAELAFAGPRHGWIELPRATNVERSEAMLYRTADGGRSWTQVSAAAGPITFTSPAGPAAAPAARSST